MKVSQKWLQKFFAEELPSAEKLGELLTFHAFEIEGIEKASDDDVLDVKVTPNRGHDCLSHRGIAKEIAAIASIKLTSDPFTSSAELPSLKSGLEVYIEDNNLCSRYMAAVVKNVKVKPSPKWLRERLEALGHRSINNIVDATNFVMLNTGQPLHAFDAKKLKEEDGLKKIHVRLATHEEKITTLDGKEYSLSETVLVITDGVSNVPIGIAGIKGGKEAEIGEATTDIIIESANFSGVFVRKASHALKLRTEASLRFEQVLSPELVAYGIRGVIELILKIAGGELKGCVDVYPRPQKVTEVSVTIDQVARLLGKTFDGNKIKDAFDRLGFSYKEANDTFTVVSPFERLDILIPEDLIEEVGRIIGYENIPALALPAFTKKADVNPRFYIAEKLREFFTNNGYSEIYTSVFGEEGERSVLNKVDSVRPYLRSSLVQGLKSSLARNTLLKDLVHIPQVKIFEIGTVWSEGKESVHVAFTIEPVKKLYTLTDTQQKLEKYLGVPLEATTKDGVVEFELDRLTTQSEIKDTYDNLGHLEVARYTPYSKFPFITRDIALWADASTASEELLRVIRENAGPLLYRIDLFDEFKKENKVSYAFRLVFQSPERTLTDEEVSRQMKNISDAVVACNCEVR